MLFALLGYHSCVLASLRAHIRALHLVDAGERVAVAVSGGADSVALLCLLLELREELGIVLSVVHLNHQLRGADADADERFVASLAARYSLDLHCERRQVRAFAEESKLSLEAAGRKLRYRFFRRLVDQGVVDKVATAHTLDDQAETVLLKLLRGSWLRGLAGIHHKLADDHGRVWVVRPLLETSRAGLREYLHSVGQDWREDLSNADPQFARNRLRALLPRLETDFNPALRSTLAQTAELARAEEEYWTALVEPLAAELFTAVDEQGPQGTPNHWGVECDAERLRGLPLALQRRLLRAAGMRIGLHLEFEEIERLRSLLEARSGARTPLAGGWEACKRRTETDSFLCLSRRNREQNSSAASYEYWLPVPGEVAVPEAGLLIRARRVEVAGDPCPAELLDPSLVGDRLLVRNWRPGDRYPAASDVQRATDAEPVPGRKLKELFQKRRIPAEQRSRWPLAFSHLSEPEFAGDPGYHPSEPEFAGGPGCNQRLVWAYGIAIALAFTIQQNTSVAIRIDAVPLEGSGGADHQLVL